MERHSSAPFLLSIISLLGLIFLGPDFIQKALAEEVVERNEGSEPKKIILSTDISAGLIDTFGGHSLVPAPFDPKHPYTSDASVFPQDIDDGLTLAAALNMDAAGLIEVLAIVPTFGNATLSAEMVVARHIAHTLKGRSDIPIVPGAPLPAGQILNPTATWFDGRAVEVTGQFGSFAASCLNLGVQLMKNILSDSRDEVTILAIGPMTDVACLLQTAPEEALTKIGEIILLAGQMEGEATTLNGIPINDFNVRMDPLGSAMLIAANRVDVPLRFMTFQLTGQTSQKGHTFGFNRDNFPGPGRQDLANKTSFEWLLKLNEVRREFFNQLFGVEEGPFDQYALVAALRPDLFECQKGRIYIQMCPYPAWSKKFATNAAGKPTSEPYNHPQNPCTSHGGPHSKSLNAVPAQLVISPDPADTGPLIRGDADIDGNIPKFDDARSKTVLACTNFLSGEARTEFKNILRTWAW